MNIHTKIIGEALTALFGKKRPSYEDLYIFWNHLSSISVLSLLRLTQQPSMKKKDNKNVLIRPVC